MIKSVVSINNNMSIPAEALHQESLDILAKLATCNKNQDKNSISNELLDKCNFCNQLNCNGNCDKENSSKPINSVSEKGLLTPQKVNPTVEPVTPTANLKMLVSAASDLQPATMQRSDFQVKKEEGYNNENSENEDPANKGKNKKGELMGRKEKSLGLLCKKFMSIYPEFSPLGTTIMLDDVVRSLNIGRRRVYDIVNVLESMEMMVRQAKNKYIWFGKSRLHETLAKLKALALRVYGSRFCHILRRYCHIQPKSKGDKNCFILPKDSSLKPSLPKEEDPLIPESIDLTENIKDETHQMEVDDLTRSIMDTIILYDHVKKDSNRSLGILCQKFIMLFMVADENTVTLDRAAKLLITEPEEGPGKYKTKVRRLYDIANILTSISFLEKCVTYEDGTKKAAYKWIGLDLNSIDCEESACKAFLSQEFSLTRHSLLTQAPIAYTKSMYANEKLKQRKFRFRSSSAHQLNATNSFADKELVEGIDKKIRSFALRTLSADTMVNKEGHVKVKKCDGFDIEEVVVEELESSANINSGVKEIRSVEDSPNQALFKQKLRDLQKEFPDKLPCNGLLDLLTVCKTVPVKDNATVSSRRRLSSDFDKQPGENQIIQLAKKQKTTIDPERMIANCILQKAKKQKIAEVENMIANCIATIPTTPDVSEKNSSTLKEIPAQTLIGKVITDKNTNTTTVSSYKPKVRLSDGKMMLPPETNPEKSTNNGVWQQATYFTIPATLQPVAKPGSPRQSITTMLVSPISNPISIPKSGLYQIIPVQCHSAVVEKNDSSTIMTASQQPATLVARQINTKPDGIKIPENTPIPIMLRPAVSVTSSPVTISPKPASLKNFTDSPTPINQAQLNGNYSEFVTPPHVPQTHYGKPPANPIIFPKMTPETPSSTGPIAQSVLTNVTRKLMSLQQDDNL